MGKPQVKYTVLRDTREQVGWHFPLGECCQGTKSQGLKTGDYTLEGFEKSFVVERKFTTSEISQNLVQDRFERELQRLDEFEFPFMVCEFELNDVMRFPENSGIPESQRSSLKISSQFLLKRLNELQLQYRTRIIFAGQHGHTFCSSLFKRVAERGLKKTT